MIPDQITRRQALQAGLMGGVTLLSGCSVLSDGPVGSSPELGQITVENGDDSPHTIHVAAERDSDLIYGSSHQLEAVSPPTDEADYGSVDTVLLEDDSWTKTHGDWVVYARVDDETAWHQQTLPADRGTDCHSVRFKIEDDGSITSFTPDCESWPPTDES